MTKNKAIEIISYHKALIDRDKSGLLDKNLEYEAIDMAIKALEQPTSNDCVSRANLIDKLEILDKRYGSDFYWNVRKIVDSLPPVTPTQCIATVRFSKDDIRKICNERIEIECTHGICKHCHNAVKNYGNGRIYCVFSNCIYDEDFYCKEFKKRGNLDGSN